MAYRFYLLDRDDHFKGVEIIEAADDSAATALADQICRDRALAGFELWDLGRRVARRAGTKA